MIKKEITELTNKYYNITGITDEDTFYKLIDSFRNLLEDIDCSVSMLRSTEDPVYLKAIEKLTERFIH